MEIKIKIGDKVSFSEIPDSYEFGGVVGRVDEINIPNNWVKVDLYCGGVKIGTTIFDLDGSRWDDTGNWKHDEIFVGLKNDEQIMMDHYTKKNEILKGVDPALAQILYSLAYDNNHANGYKEVEFALEELVGHFKQINEMLKRLPKPRSILDVESKG
jgi:hypothetical protein